MDIGTGIAIGCSVLGAVAIIFRIFPVKKNNPGNPGNSVIEKRLSAIDKKFERVRYRDSCDEIVKRLESNFKMLKEAMDTGFENLNSQLVEIRKKLN